MYKKVLIALTLLLTYAVGAQADDLSADVYEALFGQVLGHNPDKNARVIIAQELETQWIDNYTKEDSLIKDTGGTNDVDQLVEALREISKNGGELKWHPSDGRINIVRDLDGSSNPKYINKKCKFGTFYTVSKVVFNKSKNVALLKYSRHCAPMAGSGEFLILLKYNSEEGWVVIGGKTFWIS